MLPTSVALGLVFSPMTPGASLGASQKDPLCVFSAPCNRGWTIRCTNTRRL